MADVVITEYINDAAAETLRSTFSVHYDPTLWSDPPRSRITSGQRVRWWCATAPG